MPFDGVLTGTCVVAGVMTIIMGLYTNRAYALAPGLGINAIVAFQLIGGEGLSFSSAMGLIVLEGVVVTLLVLSGVREAIMRSIPVELKKAIAIGIGLFIAFIGLVFAGIVVGGAPGGPPVALGHLTTWPIFVAVFALVRHDRAARTRVPRRPPRRDRRGDDPRDDHQQRHRPQGVRERLRHVARVRSTPRQAATGRSSASSTSTRSPRSAS